MPDFINDLGFTNDNISNKNTTFKGGEGEGLK